MSYEIPQQLQYKERVLFGLTLEQAIYGAASALLSFLVYAKSNLNFAGKIIVITLLVSVGVSFMFFDMKTHSQEFLSWLRHRNFIRSSARMIKWLGLEAIEKNCYIIRSKKHSRHVALLKVHPINFTLKSDDDQSTIMYSFQKFLNALDFPIQIICLSDELNMTAYEKQLKANSLNELREVVDDHCESLLNTICKGANNKSFYIAIDGKSHDIEHQTQSASDLLTSTGLTHSRVKGLELIRLLKKYFDNENAQSIDALLLPEHIQSQKDCIKINNNSTKVVAAKGYPRIVEKGFLDKLITSSGSFDISIHIEPFPIDQTMVMLNKEINKQRADLYAAQLKNAIQPSLEIQHADTKAVLNSIQKGSEKLFHVSLYIGIKADSIEECNRLTKQVQSHLSSILVTPSLVKYRLAEGIRSLLPFASNDLFIRRNITTNALSAFFPFTSPFYENNSEGVFLGLNKNRLPIIRDIFDLSNANGAILATSGGGKSYTAKLLLSRYLMQGTKVIVIDPQSEYRKLTELYKGSVIDLSRKSKTIINPLDLLGHSYADKRLALIDLFKIMFGDLSDIQRAVIDQALTHTYDRKGITQDYYRGKVPPILSDLEAQLKRMSKEASVYERSTYTALLNRLSMYTTGAFSFLNRQTKIDTAAQFITFDIGRMPKQIKPVMMFLVLDYVYSQMKRDKSRKLLVIDEAWSMLQNAGEEGYVFEVVKTCRKFNLGLLMITQDVADLVGSKAGRAVLANSSYTVLLRQKAAVINSLQQVFHLSAKERQHLLTAAVGEGLIMLENEHQEIRFVASPKEHNVITTKPDEVEEAKRVEREELNIDLDLKEGFYQKSNLREEEIDYLLRHGFEEADHVPIGKSRQRQYLVRKIGKATSSHTFLLHSVYRLIAEYTDQVIADESSRSDSINPDIVFTSAKGVKIALEIETGINAYHHKEYLQQKIKRLNETYSEWYIILSDAQWKRRYETQCGNRVILRDGVISFVKGQLREN
ncbi:DUF87 domain-containing protein [bacterium]|nr:DUF87 domain-containing protein [bacterium]